MQQSAIRPKPRIVVTGNPFLAVVRAQSALTEAGWTESELAEFRVECGWRDVLRHPTKQMPQAVSQRAIETVKRYVEMYSPKAGEVAGEVA